ncbi:MAG: head maturation protease, ClpP-related [Pseudomonadota bacterium]
MTLRKLPKINVTADSRVPLNGTTTLTPEALDRWQPEIRAAVQGDNTISILEPIGEDTFGEGVSSKRIAAALRRNAGKDVTVQINSPGGDFFEGMTIFNMLRDHPGKVRVEVLGVAASAASIIAMSGDEVILAPGAFLMIHQASALAMGRADDMEEVAAALRQFDSAMAEIYADRSGMSEDEALTLMASDTWFNGAQAVDAGLADEEANIEVTASTGDDNGGEKAIRRIDVALAKQGISRKERRELLAEVKGVKHDADPAPATHDAGLIQALEGLLTSFKKGI